MRSTLLISMPALSLLTALAIPGRLPAQPQSPRYIVNDLGKPGLHGSTSLAFGINSVGRVGGQAQRRDGTFHAFLTGIGSTLIDLGTLGGPNSAAGGPNIMDALAIQSDTRTPDPLGEDFCAFGTHLVCRAGIWEHGVMTPLATLGGNNAAALSINNRGQLAGISETATRDATCATPAQPGQVLRYNAVVWGPAKGEIHSLPPLAGDTVGFALGINDFGQAVGSSGGCANTPGFPFPVGPHAVLWQNGVPRDLGSLSPGGSRLNVAAGINNLGMVVGGSEVAGANHTFLWTSATGMQDLGLLETDLGNVPGSGFGAINNHGQVVGVSCVNDPLCDTTNPHFLSRAYLWQNGKMVDLNSLVVGGEPLYLVFATQINDAGEIIGFGVSHDGELHAFSATPIRNSAPHEGSRAAAPEVTMPDALPEEARRFLQGRLPLGRALRQPEEAPQ